MNSTLEKRDTQPTMEEMKVMQQTALSRSIDRAANIQKAITLTEANWTGLIEALELTGRSVLKLQDTMDQLITNEDLDMMLKAQAKSLMGQHQTAVSDMQTAAAELNKSCAAHLKRTEDAIDHSLSRMQHSQETMLKEFEKQVGRVNEKYSFNLSEATASMHSSANRIRWQMYLPTIILVLWELVRQLLLLG